MLPSAVGLCLAHSLTGAERASKREEDRKRERERDCFAGHTVHIVISKHASESQESFSLFLCGTGSHLSRAIYQLFGL